jgi:hypothetical protein
VLLLVCRLVKYAKSAIDTNTKTPIQISVEDRSITMLFNGDQERNHTFISINLPRQLHNRIIQIHQISKEEISSCIARMFIGEGGCSSDTAKGEQKDVLERKHFVG